jgi:hypothetical protein
VLRDRAGPALSLVEVDPAANFHRVHVKMRTSPDSESRQRINAPEKQVCNKHSTKSPRKILNASLGHATLINNQMGFEKLCSGRIVPSYQFATWGDPELLRHRKNPDATCTGPVRQRRRSRRCFRAFGLSAGKSVTFKPARFPQTGAVSMGQCNTCLQSICWSLKTQSLSWSLI